MIIGMTTSGFSGSKMRRKREGKYLSRIALVRLLASRGLQLSERVIYNYEKDVSVPRADVAKLIDEVLS